MGSAFISIILVLQLRWSKRSERDGEGASISGDTTGISMAIDCQKDESVYHMFCPLFPDSEVGIVYVKEASYKQRLLESRSRKLPKIKPFSWPVAFEMRL